ncbi:MAG: ABC transporter ATP-binding protein [Clostridia bacterium]|nr:ABC transporter ATP-binding protein [Clostridia bacterium]
MILKCENVALSYDGRTVAENIDFQINEGDYLCILGENGSGKTTLVSALLGLKKAAGGKIIYGNGVKAENIGYLPQKQRAGEDFPACVREIVRTGFLGKRGFRFYYSKAERERAEEVMQKLGISGFAKRSFSELSGGQQKRVLLARALCSAENLLILDEPTAALDPIVTEELYEMTKKLNAEEKLSVIMVSHDVSAATKYANKILHIKHEQLFFGSTEEYLKTDLGKAYLGGHGIGG